jgi:hypothetical protein
MSAEQALGGRAGHRVEPIIGHLAGAAGYFARPYHILRGYHPEDLRPDLIAGITVGLVVLPQAVAYALIADLPPSMGLYAAISYRLAPPTRLLCSRCPYL